MCESLVLASALSNISSSAFAPGVPQLTGVPQMSSACKEQQNGMFSAYEQALTK